MSKEKRKSIRSQCVLPVELIKIEGKDHLTVRTTAHDLSDEGLKLTISFDLNPGSTMDLRLYVSEKNYQPKDRNFLFVLATNLSQFSSISTH